MKRIIKENIELIIEDDLFSKYKKKGYKFLEDISGKEKKIQKKSLSKMNTAELKEYANKLGLELDDSLTNKEIAVVIRKKLEEKSE